MARKPKDKKAADAEGASEGKKKKGLVLPAVIVTVGLLGAGYMVSSKSKKPATGTTKSAVVPLPKGPILSIDPTTINLADGHFLEIGMGLQVDSSKDLTVVTNDEALALNDAIAMFSKDTMGQLGTAQGKAAAQKALAKELAKTFDNKVTGVYFTDFVMQ